MLGAMIGDIAGSKYEFNNTFDYDFEMFGEGCDFTDDTICTVAESREPKPWLMPSGISARADSQKNLRSIKIRILKDLMIRL